MYVTLSFFLNNGIKLSSVCTAVQKNYTVGQWSKKCRFALRFELATLESLILSRSECDY